MTNSSKILYEFGPFRVDPEKQILLRDNQPVAVTPKTFETLLVLVRHSREVVSKDELMKELWPDSFVEEANLSQNIFMLRKALGDSPEERRYIVTLPGKGYRFAAEVRTITQEGEDVVIASRSRAEMVLEYTDRPPVETLPGLPPVSQRFSRRHWLTVAAVATLLAIGAFFFLHRRKLPALSVTDTIVIADFTNTTGDSVFDDTLRQGLAVQLEQSPFLRLVPDARVQQALTLMGEPPNARLTPELARQVCERLGGAAVLHGSIALLGKQYVLGLRAIDCRTGNILADEQAQTENGEDVLKALSKIAGNARTRLGESLATIEQHNVALEMATTPSLEALKAFSTGMRLNETGGYTAALPLFQRAVQLDPQFALAYAHLGLKYSEMGESQLASESTAKAYELRDRASDRERFFIIALYHRQVTGNLEKEQQTLQLWADTYPRDPLPHSLLSGFATQGTGQYEKSIEEANTALKLDPDSGPPHVNVAFANVYLDRPAEVEKTLAESSGWPQIPLIRYYLAFLKADQSAMENAAALAKGKPDLEPQMLSIEALAQARFGHAEAADANVRLAVEMAERSGQKEAAATYEAGEAVWQALFGKADAAKRDASMAFQISNGRDVEFATAFAFALAGDRAQSEALTVDLEKRFPEDTSVQFNYLPAVRALLAQSRHQYKQALELLQPAAARENAVSALAFNFFYGSMYPVYARGHIYLALNQPVQAAAEFQKIIDRRGNTLLDPIAPVAHLQLARAYAAQRDVPKARSEYESFLSLWKDADPGIPIYRQAKAEYEKLW
jgi:DNA-binding winged helix-turn-helix (wHTH) protein/tetratricopeptide (TPR) repeat protein